MKNSFILFQNYREYFEDLTGDEAKELLFAIFDYEKTRTKPVNLSTKVSCYFLVIKQQLDKQYQEYMNIAKKNRENINKRWNKDIPKDTKNTNGINGNKVIPKILDNDIDNDIDIDNGSDIDIDKDNTKESLKKKSAKSTKAHTKFVKPTKEELKDYALQEHLTTDIIDEFMDYYDSNGWRLKGGLSMKDWKASYRRWCRNQRENPKNKGNPFLEMLKEKYPEEANNIFPDNVVDTEGVEQ